MDREAQPKIWGRGYRPRKGPRHWGGFSRRSGCFPQVIVSTRDFRPLIEQQNCFHAGSNTRGDQPDCNRGRRKHPRPSLSTQLMAPRNEIESKLVEIWKETLSVEEIGVHDNFFEVGGDSLLATQLISRLSETFRVDLSLRALFETPTVANLALVIIQKHAALADERTLAEALSEISRLSEDERRALLEQDAS